MRLMGGFRTLSARLHAGGVENRGFGFIPMLSRIASHRSLDTGALMDLLPYTVSSEALVV